MQETILIIDDEVQIRRLLEITLSASGYKISEASTGKEGLTLAATRQPAFAGVERRRHHLVCGGLAGGMRARRVHARYRLRADHAGEFRDPVDACAGARA